MTGCVLCIVLASLLTSGDILFSLAVKHASGPDGDKIILVKCG